MTSDVDSKVENERMRLQKIYPIVISLKVENLNDTIKWLINNFSPLENPNGPNIGRNWVVWDIDKFFFKNQKLATTFLLRWS